MRRNLRGVATVWWQLLAGLTVLGLLAPTAENPVDALRTVEIGMTIVIYGLLVEWLVLFRRRYHASPDATAATPWICVSIAVATAIALAGNTIEVLRYYVEHSDAVHPPTIAGFFSQIAALCWLLPFIGKLREDERAA